jgi:glutamine amidotransferase PdxT
VAIDGNAILEKLALAFVQAAAMQIGDLGGESSDIETVLRRAADIAQTMAIHDCSNCPIQGTCPVAAQLSQNQNEEGDTPDGDYGLNNL